MMSFTDNRGTFYGPMPVVAKPVRKYSAKDTLTTLTQNLENPVILLRDILRYPSPLDPFNETGWLQRQKTVGGPIERVGM